MKALPTGYTNYSKTPVFTEITVPPSLLKSHSTKKGVWGKICVLKGILLYTIEREEAESVELTVEKYGVVEPEVLHHVTPMGEVEFFVEFYRSEEI